MMRGKRENFFSREKKPNVGFVILSPLSRHSLGDGGSHPFKKSGETFLFTFTYPSLSKYQRNSATHIPQRRRRRAERECGNAEQISLREERGSTR